MNLRAREPQRRRTPASSGGPSAHSRLTPCFSSLCRALLGSEKALSWWLGIPEFLSEPLFCWKKVWWATLRVP